MRIGSIPMEPIKITQGSKVLQPEYEKLTKLEKLLSKIENDLHKRMKDLDRNAVIDTLKRTHSIYQLILSEMHFQLSELRLDKFTSILQKIFGGQNILLDVLLKIRINSELHPDQFLEHLTSLKRSRRSRSVDRKDQPFDTASLSKGAGLSRIGMSQMNQLKRQIATSTVSNKKYVEKGTDTELDRNEAKSSDTVQMKLNELDAIQREMQEGNEEMNEILKNRLNLDNKDASNAERSIKNVLSELSKKKQIGDSIDEETNLLLKKQEDLKGGYKNMEDELTKGLMGVAQKAKETQMLQLRNNFRNTNIPVELADNETQTERDVLKERFDKLNMDCKAKDKKLVEIEKKFKDSKRDTETLEGKLKALNLRLDEMAFLERKREEEQRRSRKDKDIAMTQLEKEKMKKYVEETIRLKLKMKELLDEIKKIEQENIHNLEHFKRFLMGTNLSDEQKRMLLAKVEELFKTDFSKRFNFKEIEHLARIDLDTLKDSLFKDIIGGDPTQFIKKIKAEQKQKAQERLNPNYDADFDPDLLEDGQRIVVRKVKKKIQRFNSKGELVEDEIEVEEEVVLDKNGNEIRKREKPKAGVVMDPSMIEFIKKHGGLAVGGSKFILPQKPGRPKAKDGGPIKEGEWFVDERGNKVKMMKNANGEEEFEIEEKYIDENGIERVRIKQMKVKKDANGDEYTEESYIDPSTGKRVQVIKKVIKDKDGNDIIEETLTDENGKKITKRTKVKKDKDGNEIIEEEIIDEFGNKQIIRTKKMKDANGNDIIVKEIINADGSKIVLTEKVDQNGVRTVIEEKTDQFGKKTRTEKKMIIGADGKPVIEEVVIDENGNRILKKTKMLVDENGSSYQQEEIVDQHGNKVIKNTRRKIDKDGNEYTEEETIDAFGNKVIKNVRKKVDKDGNEFIEEEIINADGTKKIVKRRIDKDGNQVEEEEFIDEFGNKIIVKKIVNKDGTITEERFNQSTGEKTIVKRRIDESGREIIEETKIDASGNITTVKKVVSKDRQGNTIVEETYVDPTTGELITVKRKIVKGKDGKDIIEEQIIDSNGNIKIVKKRIYKDADGREIIEEEVIGADGKKYNIKKKVYRDADGNQIEEEERIDEFGNKVIIKKKIGADGKEVIEEVRISKDGKKTIIQKIINKDGTVEETIIDPTGKVTKRIHKLGTDDKQVQTEQKMSLRDFLLDLGCDKSKVDELVDAIMRYIQKGEAIVVGDEQNIANKITEKGMKIPGFQKTNFVPMSKRKGNQEELEDKNEVLDGLTEDQQIEKLFEKMKQKKNEYGDLYRMIRNQVGKNGDEELTPDDFKNYMRKFTDVHSKCGDNCPHLRRFYERLGFTWLKYKRRFLKLKDTRIQAFNKVKELEPTSTANKLTNSNAKKTMMTTTPNFNSQLIPEFATERQTWDNEIEEIEDEVFS